MAPMRYKLKKLTQPEILVQISERTQGFYTMSANSADWIQRDIRSREFSSMGSIEAPSCKELCDLIIGENDYFLKLTTKNHNVDFIYHDYEDNEFQFWGEYQCCIRAMNELRYRVLKITERERQKRHEANNCKSKSIKFVNEQTNKIQRSTSTYTPSYSPMSPTYTPNWTSDEFDYADTVPLQENYSKTINNQMFKMGFKAGAGLGINNDGRVKPISAINELGGRTHNRHFGLGFNGEEVIVSCADKPLEVSNKPLEVSNKPVEVSIEPADLTAEEIRIKEIHAKLAELSVIDF